MIVLLLAIFATEMSRSENPPLDDVQSLQGTWHCIKAIDADEGEASEKEIAGSQFVFLRDKFCESKEEGEEPEWVAYKLDPSKKPKEIDFDLEVVGIIHHVKGIYHLEGNLLKLRWGAERPTDFISKIKGMSIYQEFKRGRRSR